MNISELLMNILSYSYAKYSKKGFWIVPEAFLRYLSLRPMLTNFNQNFRRLKQIRVPKLADSDMGLAPEK